MAYESSLDEKKDLKIDNSTTDKIEDVSESEHAQHLAELSSIEATAASKAAWLISITVSLGGLLFGTADMSPHP
jgi:SP family myo-inositol transporter-like MFS transporter 13